MCKLSVHGLTCTCTYMCTADLVCRCLSVGEVRVRMTVPRLPVYIMPVDCCVNIDTYIVSACVRRRIVK